MMNKALELYRRYLELVSKSMKLYAEWIDYWLEFDETLGER